jgi:hypothetical protein
MACSRPRLAAAHLLRWRSHRPRYSSDLPLVSGRWGTGYISAVSKKLTPAAMHCSSSWQAAAKSVASPNSMVPVGPGGGGRWVLQSTLQS